MFFLFAFKKWLRTIPFLLYVFWGGNSSPNQEENQEDAEMEQTLRSGEEETVDLEEGKSSKEENEVSVFDFLNFLNNY